MLIIVTYIDTRNDIQVPLPALVLFKSSQPCFTIWFSMVTTKWKHEHLLEITTYMKIANILDKFFDQKPNRIFCSESHDVVPLKSSSHEMNINITFILLQFEIIYAVLSISIELHLVKELSQVLSITFLKNVC